MDRDEILRIVSDLHDKDLNRFNDEPAKEEIPWPKLDPVALYELAGEIVRAIEPQTEADPVAILVQLLVFFGNMIGRNPHFRVEATKHFANLFAVLVGETAKGRKGTSEARVRELFESIHDDWLLKRILTGLSSGEGLIWAVRDPIEKTKPVEEDGRIIDYQTYISDHGIADKRLLLIESEFASVLRIAKRDGNILSTTIRAAWDSGNLQIMTKNSPARATNAHISIIGHITKEELLTCMSEVEGFNGFANRFEWLCVKRSQLLPKGGAPVDLSSHRSRLQDAVDFAKSIGEMQRDVGAEELWAKLYEQMDKGHSGMFGAVTSRAEAQVLRLSLIYALLDETKIIRTEHLQAAMALWQYAEDSARYIFGSSTGHKLTDTLLRLIREQPRTKKDLHDKTNRHYTAKELDQALGKLERLKLIKRETVENTGGRPAIRWSAI